MTIRKEQKDRTLTLYIGGMLNTNTAPELEKELLADLPGAEDLVLDLEKLEYISSAGLRVLITAQKKMERQGSITLVNVCPGIKEVFDITGLTEFFHIE